MLTGFEELEDRNILFYVSGYFARSLTKTLSCKDCTVMVKENRAAPTLLFEDIEEDDDEKKRFILQIDRGGLCWPTEICYGTCLIIWNLYTAISNNHEAKSLLVSSLNSQKVFTEIVKKLFNQSDSANESISVECSSGHSFKENVFPQLIARMFNLFAKNLRQEYNSVIHQGKKRNSGGNEKEKSERQRKAQKLTSE